MVKRINLHTVLSRLHLFLCRRLREHTILVAQQSLVCPYNLLCYEQPFIATFQLLTVVLIYQLLFASCKLQIFVNQLQLFKVSFNQILVQLATSN